MASGCYCFDNGAHMSPCCQSQGVIHIDTVAVLTKPLCQVGHLSVEAVYLVFKAGDALGHADYVAHIHLL